MMTESEIIQLWGEDGLIRHTDTDIIQGLNYETNHYLSSVGLPKESILLLNFNIKIKPISKADVRSINKKYILIGYEDDRDYVCLNESLEVVIINKETNIEHYVNSSLKKFIQCLSEYKKVQKERAYRYKKGMELDSEEVAKELEKKLISIDGSIASSEYFWPVITEQIEFDQL